MFTKVSKWLNGLKAQRDQAREVLSQAAEGSRDHGHSHQHFAGVVHAHGHGHEDHDHDHHDGSDGRAGSTHDPGSITGKDQT